MGRIMHNKTLANTIQFVYFWISVGSTYVVYYGNDDETDRFVQVVLAMCAVDFAVHYLGWSRMRTDMIIHHTFVGIFIIVLGIFDSRSDTLFHRQQRRILIATMLSTEISSMFLVVIPLFRRGRGTIRMVNYMFFATTFVYYRLYKYTVNLVASMPMHQYIYAEICNTSLLSDRTHVSIGVSCTAERWWLYIAVECTIMSMWILNWYWFAKIGLYATV